MVRVHSASQGLDAAGPAAAGASSSSSDQTSAEAARSQLGSEQPEEFTIWMKSLVLNGSGCTVYDSAGSIVYRVDNYGARRATDVCLMDLAGNVVLQILKKKLGFGRRWEGYRWSDQEQELRRRPWFKVARAWAWRGPSRCTCELRGDGAAGLDAATTVRRYRMDDGRIAPSRGARIVDGVTGLAVAEVKRKTTAAGVALGADVLTLAVEPGVDRSIIMGLVLVHGLINRAM
ncbi:protein LURP-one-related 11-like [Panicum miliaceum]|uniref:Protein LURP-one-related 11-like n=1 Tax=Panicum miliaceum TaxID=4540 RepID=A0A3L6TQL5_PANMI|nr:protein LURP-one-related 11-like [Panicum miliaceum]